MSWGVTVYPRTLISPSNGTDVEVYLTTSLFTCCKSNNFQEIICVHVNTGARNPAAIAFTLVSESAEVSGGCRGAEFQLWLKKQQHESCQLPFQNLSLSLCLCRNAGTPKWMWSRSDLRDHRVELVFGKKDTEVEKRRIQASSSDFYSEIQSNWAQGAESASSDRAIAPRQRTFIKWYRIPDSNIQNS